MEILVLTHLRHDSEPLEVEELRDFSDSLDFLTPEEPEGMEEGEEIPDSEAVEVDPLLAQDSLEDSLLAGDEVFEEEAEPEPWANVHHIEERSDIMQEAWRRLRLSAPFRPQQYLSWVQSENEPFPLLRVHNQEAVLVIDPYAEERAALEAAAEEENEALESSGESTSMLPSGSADDEDLNGETAEEEPGLPDPTQYYELDGTARLVRTRFLHLEFDLVMRTPQFELTEETELEPLMFDENGLAIEPEEPVPSSFLIHDLQQRRQVRSNRMEYFDGPVLSVLAYISDFDIETLAEEEALDDGLSDTQP